MVVNREDEVITMNAGRSILVDAIPFHLFLKQSLPRIMRILSQLGSIAEVGDFFQIQCARSTG